LGAIVGLLLSAFNLLNVGGKLPASLVVAAGGVGLVAGSLVGALLARRLHFRPRLNAKDAEIAAKEGELATKNAEIAKLKVYRDAARRHEAYAKHVHLLLMQMHGDGIADEEDSLLLEPAKVIEEATGTKVRFSVWSQTRPTAGLPKWKIERAPDHTDRQCRAFAVSLKDSWISFMENLKRNGKADGEHSAKDFVFGLPDLEEEKKAQGRDLTAFLESGFRSFRCTSVTSADCGESDDVQCLVVLAENPDAFDETEDWYIVFLGQILGLHRRMTQPVAEDAV
jgi:hypothetical protein